MRTLHITSIALLIMALASFICIPLSMARLSDDDHLSANDSVYSSYGYLNKPIQQVKAIEAAQEAPHKSLLQNIKEYLLNKTENNIEQNAAEKPTPVLQQKQSSSNKARTASARNTYIIDPARNNLAIGTGALASQEKDASGRLIAEVIDGTRYIYAGFTSVGTATIRDAVAKAKTGDRIIVKDGVYNEAITIAGNAVDNGFGLYGGYDESGINTGATTTINGGISFKNMSGAVEVNGFNITGSGLRLTIGGRTAGPPSSIVFDHVTNVTLTNSTFSGSSTGAFFNWCPIVSIKNNTFNNSSTGVYLVSSGELIDAAGKMIPGGSFSIIGNTFNDSRGVWSESSWGLMAESNTFNTGTDGLYISRDDAQVVSTNNNYNNVTGSGIYYLDGYMLGSNIKSTNDYFMNNINGSDYGRTGYLTITDTSYAPNQTGATSFALPQSSINSVTDNLTTLNLRIDNPYNITDSIYSQNYGDTGKSSIMDQATLTNIFKSLLLNNDKLTSQTGQTDPLLVARLAKDSLGESSLAIPVKDPMSVQEMDVAMRLASIFKNPTDDQKTILDAIKALLNDTDKLEKESGKQTNPELIKAQNALLQAVANILLAQAVPDLLKQGDITNIKSIFYELDTKKNKIMFEYDNSTKPYYENMKNMIKELAQNMPTVNNLLSSNMSKKDLDKMLPSDLDKIWAEIKYKIEKEENRTLEEKKILKQEADCRRQYLNPGKQKLEYDMKNMLKDFTGKINGVLKAADKK